MEIRKIPASELRVAGSKQPKIVGEIPYNSESKPMGFTEVLKPGVFGESIADDKKIISLWNHDTSKPLANTKAGTLKLRDTSTHLEVTIVPDVSISWAKDAVESIRRGDVEGLSFGFTVNPDGETWTRAGVRELTSVTLFEVSPVTFPAYPETHVNVRSNKNMNTKELREERYKIHQEMKRLNDKGLDGADSRTTYERLDSEYERISDLIDKKEGEDERERKLNERDGYLNRSQHEPIKPDPNYRNFERATNNPKYSVRASEEYRRDFEKILIRGEKFLSAEKRALMVDDDSQAGFLVAPEKFQNEVIKAVDDETYALEKCRVIPVPNAASLGIPALDNDPEDADWTGEITQVTSDSTMDVSKRVLSPHPLSKEVRVSKPLVRISELAGPLVRDRLGYKFGVTVEKGWISGNGVNRPLGLMTVSDLGITTSRDVSTGNTATAIKADNLIDCAFSLKSQYLRNAEWVFHRDAMKQIRKLKDGEGAYLYESSLQKGTPNMLLGLPVNLSEYMNNTFSASEYVGILGDFKRGYYWAIRQKMEIQVLVELYAATNQNGYIGRMELDGMPVLEEAFVRVQLAA